MIRKPETGATAASGFLRLTLATAALLLSPFVVNADNHEDDADTTWDGLVPIEDARVHAAFIDPNADFAVFQRVAILDPHVAFRSNWQRDQNRGRSRNVSASDVERIKGDVAQILKDVFTETLEEAGYEIANYVGEDVLILRPAIIDLDITAPDVQRAGRNRTYTASAGAATLFLEMIDSQSGALIGRAIDRRSARRGGGFATRANRVTNRADARREFRRWADQLVSFLDEHYLPPPEDE